MQAHCPLQDSTNHPRIGPTEPRSTIVTVFYSGTNPNHHFSIEWGRCRMLRDRLHGPGPRTIGLRLLDEQGNDAAIKQDTKVIKVPLARLSCRPATVTLWIPPNSYISVHIP